MCIDNGFVVMFNNLHGDGGGTAAAVRCVVKRKFHYADFPVTPGTSPRQTRTGKFRRKSA